MMIGGVDRRPMESYLARGLLRAAAETASTSSRELTALAGWRTL
jgi:hypothetical protein